MVLLESVTIPLGTKMPDFEIKDPEGKVYKGHDLYGKRGLLVAFTCNHCPYAIAVWPRFIRLANYARNLEIATVAINPNINQAYPDDSPQKMLIKIKEWGINFPYLVDETQDVARDFKAQCTPDIYLFNKDHKLIYHGRIDDNWQDESKVTREELKEALNHHATGQPISLKQMPSMGCSIKWRIAK
ncbi:MAG TPA: thioredoxin family protein [Candidatus Omnitrophica bacterium]|nr:MAG: peroxiredoxin [Omnitrophica WOR_2 bacterium GWA2_45_18]OGX19058.1 MAG: peroxiredoxin [Omnitrophica WOR_2 bacterium GWC2_45_7]HBR14020.1 thioredoxin family protein [Candidatus Omnitrophota bacterium]